jgi:CheY-like chemotaxis protein
MDRIRVLVADDHAPFRDGLRALLRSEADIEMVGEAASGQEAITQATHLQPDVILMDLHMPEGNGIEATRTILATSPHISILVLTMFEATCSKERSRPRFCEPFVGSAREKQFLALPLRSGSCPISLP